jgi:hypothetical protein
MAELLEACGDSILGWYHSPDRMRIHGTLRALQNPGAIVNLMKALFPNDPEPLNSFPSLTGRMRNLIEKLQDSGVPFFDGDPGQGKKRKVSDKRIQQWLEGLYQEEPRAGSLVAIVRTREFVRSFSCRRRKHQRAKGNPKTGQRPREIANHHLIVASHNIHVFYFFVYDPVWGRASIRISSYLPFDVTLQLNGHEFLARQIEQRSWKFQMQSNAVAHVSNWEKLRDIVAQTDYEQEIRCFAGRWLKRLPHGLNQTTLHILGNYHWTIHVLECSLNYVFRDPSYCRPVFDQLLGHNLLLGSLESIRTLFDLKRRPVTSSNQITTAEPMACIKAFWGPNWMKIYDKHSFILRFEIVINDVTMFVTNKSLSNARHLMALGQNVCRRLERSSVSAAHCPVRARVHTLLEGVHDDSGRRFGGIRAERRAEQTLLVTLSHLSHTAAGFSNREFRHKHHEMTGQPLLKTSQASYRLRKFRAHGLVEPVGKTGRFYQLTDAGRRMLPFLIKVYQQLLSPGLHAIRHGLLSFKHNVQATPIDRALENLYQALGLVAA